MCWDEAMSDCFENYVGQEFDSCQTAVSLEFESIFQAIMHV